MKFFHDHGFILSLQPSEPSPARGSDIKNGGLLMVFYLMYALAVIVLILHFTGVLARRNMEWLVLTTPVIVFAVIILDYLNLIP